MRKLILLMLVVMVPYFTMAQRKSKKNKKVETVSSYEFMVISGYEMMTDGDRNTISLSDAEDVTTEMKVKILMQSKTKLIVEFDLGLISREESIELNEQSRNFRTMASAVQAADKRGWEFHSANVVVLGSARVHYYYMTRNK